jgi:DNA-directed RNA polymerase specialized sigma24 family protein
MSAASGPMTSTRCPYVRRLFTTAWLLTGNTAQAIDALVKALESAQLSGNMPARLMSRVITFSLQSRSTTECVHDHHVDSCSLTLPVELQRVLNLPADPRRCFVLRLLLGLTRNDTAALLKCTIPALDQSLRIALQQIGESVRSGVIIDRQLLS